MVTSQELVVDVRGQACPIPVIRVKKALESLEQGRLVVLIDEKVALENVTRLAAHLGYTRHCEPCADGFRLTLDKSAGGGAA